MTDFRQKGKIRFEGELRFPDGTVNVELLDHVADLWDQRRRLEGVDNHSVELPIELSAEECEDPYIRDFYRSNPEAVSVVIRRGESYKNALSRQCEESKNHRTFALQEELLQALKYHQLPKVRDFMNRILDVDPLNLRSPSPVQDNWDVPSPEPWDDEVDEPQSKEPRWDDPPT
jgi:hypothetical protein